ncbi:MAG TPA: phosphoribosylanthranilate isomerase [Thermoplasmata archaeon]|nr:phosphoribosylanthranilate isomerase [Thermoplasmata archaeon]
MTTFVKFCGLSDAATIALVPEGGAAGFVIDVPGSPRAIPLERAAKLAEVVPSDREIWAVTVDPSVELILRIFEEMGTDRVQVHGRIPDGLDTVLRRHIVPSLAIPRPGSGDPTPELPGTDLASLVHLDAAGGALPGGGGVVPDWEICARIIASAPGRKIVLGGGLTPENVESALSTVAPWGVDVSSGIESAPGRKDPTRMLAFLGAVRRWEAHHA